MALLGAADEADWTRRASQQAVRRLLLLAARGYASRRRVDPGVRPSAGDGSLSPTEVLIAVTDLLRAAEVEPFEIGMWESWGLPSADRL